MSTTLLDPKGNALPPSLAQVPNIPFKEQTLEQLLAERSYWEERIQEKTGWGAAVGAIGEIMRDIDMHVELRRRVEPTEAKPLKEKSVYVAAPFDNQRVAVMAAADLAVRGWQVTAGWLKSKLVNTSNRHECVQAAKLDLADVKRARVLVVLTDPRPIGAGHHVELGYFRAWRELEPDRRVVLVGPHKSVFHWLADYRYDSWKTALEGAWLDEQVA